MLADGLALLGTRTSAGTVMIEFGFHIYGIIPIKNAEPSGTERGPLYCDFLRLAPKCALNFCYDNKNKSGIHLWGGYIR